MVFWYDREGKPLEGSNAPAGSPAWTAAIKQVDAWLRDPEYKIVAQDHTPGGTYWVSTVWLGIDHDFTWFDLENPNPSPIIFETMVFKQLKEPKQITMSYGRAKVEIEREDLEQERYWQLEAARGGHKRMLQRYTDMENVAKIDGISDIFKGGEA